MNPYTCRNAQVTDASRIAHVQVQTWHSAYTGIIDPDYLNNLSETEKTSFWQAALEQGAQVAVASEHEHGEVIGFISYGRDRYDNTKGHVYALYILSEFHGKGIGKALMQEAFNVLKTKGYNHALLWVLKHNPHKDFYTHMGGRIIACKTIQIGNTVCEEECMEFSL